MTRRAYALTPLPPTTKNTRYGVFDIETKHGDDDHEFNTEFLVAGCTVDGETVEFFTDAESMVAYMTQAKFAGMTWYAYNGGRFDFAYVFEALRGKKEYDVVLGGSGILFGEIHQGNVTTTVDESGKIHHHGKRRSWKLWDINQVLQGSLRDNLRAFGCSIQKGEADYATLADTPETRDYLRSDVLGTYELIHRFYDQPELAGIPHCPTAASLSMRVFRTHFLTLTIPTLPRSQEDFCRLGYVGGRCQPFRLGIVHDVRAYDVNSMYGEAMTLPLPVSAGVEVEERSRRGGIIGIYEAEVDVPATLRFGPLPVRHHGKLIYPVGHVHGVWPTPELDLAESLGCTVRILYGIEFAAQPFISEFARAEYAARSGGGVRKQLAKLLNNSLYGKFGMRRDRSKWMHVQNLDELPPDAVSVNEALGLWEVGTELTGSAVMPHIAACITSYARTILYRGLMAAGEHAVYCDTDSVYVADGATLPPDMVSETRLGAYKIEETADTAYIAGPKAYVLHTSHGDKVRMKGIPQRLAGEIVAALEGGAEEAGTDWWQFVGAREAVHPLHDRTGFGFVGEAHRRRTARSGYSGAHILADGTTVPLRMEDVLAAEEERERDQAEIDARRYALRIDEGVRSGIRRMILLQGGIRDRDYESIPTWARRKNGLAMDDMATLCGFRTADDLARFLLDGTLLGERFA